MSRLRRRHRERPQPPEFSSCSSPASRSEARSAAPAFADTVAPGPQPSLPGHSHDGGKRHVAIVEPSQQQRQHYNQLQPRHEQHQDHVDSLMNSHSTRAAAAVQDTDAIADPSGLPSRPIARPRTSSERGRAFRLRQKQYEKDLVGEVRLLRRQVDQLSHSRELLAQNTSVFLSPTNQSAVLVELVRELHTVLRHGLEPQPSGGGRLQATRSSSSMDTTARNQLSAIEHKESFLRRVLDPDVRHGDLVGVDAVIGQMRKHTAAYSKFELEIRDVQAITSTERSSIVVSSLKIHVRFSRESLPKLFPGALEQIPVIAAKFLDRDFSLDCGMRFQFSESGQIKVCVQEIDFVEALVKEFGSARDVAELIQFYVVT